MPSSILVIVPRMGQSHHRSHAIVFYTAALHSLSTLLGGGGGDEEDTTLLRFHMIECTHSSNLPELVDLGEDRLRSATPNFLIAVLSLTLHHHRASAARGDAHLISPVRSRLTKGGGGERGHSGGRGGRELGNPRAERAPLMRLKLGQIGGSCGGSRGCAPSQRASFVRRIFATNAGKRWEKILGKRKEKERGKGEENN